MTTGDIETLVLPQLDDPACCAEPPSQPAQPAFNGSSGESRQAYHEVLPAL